MSLFERSFRCPREGCGGLSRAVRKDGRFYTHRGVNINVPENFIIPRCEKCQKDFMTDAMFVALTQVLEIEYQRHADIIRKVLKRHKESQ